MKSYYIENIFSQNLFEDIKKEILLKINSNCIKYDKENYGRFYMFLNFEKDIELKIIKEVEKKTNLKSLNIIFSQIVKYQIVDEVIPGIKPHKDNNPCEFILDITIDTTMTNWGLNVNEDFFPDINNNAVFLVGNEEIHSRPDYPSSNKEDYVILLFINFARKDHWSMKIKKIMTPQMFKMLNLTPVKIFSFKLNPNQLNDIINS